MIRILGVIRPEAVRMRVVWLISSSLSGSRGCRTTCCEVAISLWVESVIKHAALSLATDRRARGNAPSFYAKLDSNLRTAIIPRSSFGSLPDPCCRAVIRLGQTGRTNWQGFLDQCPGIHSI